MTILESPLFKHYKPIQEKADQITRQHVRYLSEQFIKSCFQIPKELEDQYRLLGHQIETMPFQPEITDWIGCKYRISRYLGEGQVESYCENPHHPAAHILWAPLCLKKECDLRPICDE